MNTREWVWLINGDLLYLTNISERLYYGSNGAIYQLSSGNYYAMDSGKKEYLVSKPLSDEEYYDMVYAGWVTIG